MEGRGKRERERERQRKEREKGGWKNHAVSKRGAISITASLIIDHFHFTNNSVPNYPTDSRFHIVSPWSVSLNRWLSTSVESIHYYLVTTYGTHYHLFQRFLVCLETRANYQLTTRPIGCTHVERALNRCSSPICTNDRQIFSTCTLYSKWQCLLLATTNFTLYNWDLMDFKESLYSF